MAKDRDELSLDLVLLGLERRVIWIDDDIDEDTLDVIRYIIEWNYADRDVEPNERVPIKLMFFSPGGLLDVNNALIDAISLSKTPVHGYNMGICQSAAAFIFLSCHQRFIMPNASFLFHQGSGLMAGSHDTLMAQMEDTYQHIQRLEEFIVERTSYTNKEVDGKMKGEWYVYAEEAVDRGIAQSFITDLEELF